MTSPGVRMSTGWASGRTASLREASVMSIEVPAPRPGEYERKKLAPYEFAPMCEVDVCAQRAGRAIQCTNCDAVITWFCVPHALGVPEQMPPEPVECGECGAQDLPTTLIRVLTLAGWF